ncbi:MAG: serine/threonine-protein kinase [Gemmatimonadales bacterium]
MNRERERRIEALFLAALELPPGERDAAIRQAAADPELAADALALLAAHEETGDLDRIGRDLGARPDDDDDGSGPDPLIGSLIGPYRLLRLLGQGGMGTVYLAERADGQFEHRVAIKLLRSDRPSADLRRRFLTERQILAQLVHNNIALLLDGSVTDDGRPYLVMEYVAGRPLLDYCDGRALPVRRRLELFLEVCSAVEYAHRRLVVHRDLKPGNTLVTDDGGVKLLDFGIAKLLDPELGVGEATETGGRLMTPEYASPEQVRGEPVGTASDVYQLGVLLYELLTGRRPYSATGRSREAIEQAILSADPLRPSTAITAGPATPETVDTAARVRGATAGRLSRQLAGDLDQIVLKALRKEADRRYGSVTELAEDVRRHLDGRPVLARRGTFRYRASRFVRRNRAGVSAGAVAAAALAAGVVGTVTQARRAEREAASAVQERDRAQAEQARAEQIASVLTGMFDIASEGGVRTDTVRLLSVLGRAIDRLDEQLADQPDVHAATLIAVSDLYEKIGRYDEALPHAERALALRQGDSTTRREDRAEALKNLGGVRLNLGQLDSAAAAYEAGLALWRDGADAARDSIALHNLAISYHNVAVVHWRQRRLPVAESLATLAIASYRAAREGKTTGIANSLDLLAIVKRALGKRDQILPNTEEALAVRRELLPPRHLLLAVSLNNHASGLLELERYDEAETLFREALEMRRELLGESHPMVATAYQNLGAVYRESGRLEEAVPFFERAIEIHRATLPPGHLDLAGSISSLALLQHQRGRYREALTLLEDAMPMWEAGLRPGHGLLFKTRALIGDCLAKLGRFGAAERELKPAYEALVEHEGPGHSETRRAKAFLAALYRDWGKPALAARYEDSATGG